MDDVAQIAVVAGGGVAHHRVDLRRVGERQFRAVVEPHRGVGPPAALARQAADDPRRFDAGAEGGAGDRAGDQHRRMVERLRRQVAQRWFGSETRRVRGRRSSRGLPRLGPALGEGQRAGAERPPLALHRPRRGPSPARRRRSAAPPMPGSAGCTRHNAARLRRAGCGSATARRCRTRSAPLPRRSSRSARSRNNAGRRI